MKQTMDGEHTPPGIEKVECDEEMNREMARAEALHGTWWKLNTFLEEHGRNMNQLSGWDDIQLMRDFAKDNPEIIEVHVDDAHHCNSYVFMIPHESDNDYMGATCIFVPQCCGIINQFFLYPGDARGMYRAMLALERKFQEKGDERFQELYGDLNEDDSDSKD